MWTPNTALFELIIFNGSKRGVDAHILRAVTHERLSPLTADEAPK